MSRYCAFSLVYLVRVLWHGLGTISNVIWLPQLWNRLGQLNAYTSFLGQNNINKAPSSSAGANVNNVNKSSSLADDGFVNVTRSSSRSVVPTAAVLAAELLKRTTPPSVVGVPKCRKKLQ